MKDNKGFTLLEIIVVLVIIGIAAAFIIPNIVASMEQTNAQAAKNNLLAISAAQQKFSEDYSGSYCISTGNNPTGLTNSCGDTVADLNANLHLGISDKFTYSCSAAAGETIPYNCTATDGTVTLLLDPNDSGAANNCTAAGLQPPVCCTAGGPSCPS